MLRIYVDFNSRDLSESGKESIILPMDVQQSDGCAKQLIEGAKISVHDGDIQCEALLRCRETEIWKKGGKLWMAEIIPGTVQDDVIEAKDYEEHLSG